MVCNELCWKALGGCFRNFLLGPQDINLLSANNLLNSMGSSFYVLHLLRGVDAIIKRSKFSLKKPCGETVTHCIVDVDMYRFRMPFMTVNRSNRE